MIQNFNTDTKKNFTIKNKIEKKSILSLKLRTRPIDILFLLRARLTQIFGALIFKG